MGRPAHRGKLAVRDRRALRSRLRGLGFRVVQPRHFESNALFDFPDLRLWKARCLLRLRQEGKRWLLTFKGTPLEPRHFKIRSELATEVEDGSMLRQLLDALGLRESFRYEKYRTVLARNARRFGRRRAWWSPTKLPSLTAWSWRGGRAGLTGWRGVL